MITTEYRVQFLNKYRHKSFVFDCVHLQNALITQRYSPPKATRVSQPHLVNQYKNIKGKVLKQALRLIVLAFTYKLCL